MPSTTALLREYADYDLWANTRFVERLAREPDNVLDAPVASSFPSLRKTVLHIRDAENAWLCRLMGQPVPWPADDTIDMNGLLRVSRELHAFTHGCAEADLDGPREFKTLKGDPQQSRVWRMLHHCFNHSTQHRGQLITMMRSLGLADIPANDLVAFQRTLTT